jgi:hypothetical protein
MDLRQATAGVATVSLVDDAGADVGTYTVEVGAGALELDSSASGGAPGTWQVTIELEGFSGVGDVSLSATGD